MPQIRSSCVLMIKLLFCALPLLRPVNGDATAIIRLKKFTNTNNTMWNGRKCDEADGPCDNVFELCVKQFPPLPTSSSNNNCLYYFHTSDLIAKIVDFEHESTGIDKDIKLNFTAYTGIGFFMKIIDNYYWIDDHVDNHVYGEKFTPGYNGTIKRHSRLSYGQRSTSKSTLSFTVKVSCYLHYYDNKCSTYCKPTDDASGHYTCDSAGNRICRENWYILPYCLTYCAPHDDDLNGHYTCSKSGTRVCRLNWYILPNCVTHCEPRDDTVNGHYTCGNNGTRVCHPNWYNSPNCTAFCTPRDDINGHYFCSQNGTRVFNRNWYNLPNCTRYCEAKNDSTGHYNCLEDGQRVCLQHWFTLPNCTTFCEPMDGDMGHYSCEPNGSRHCLENWYGLPNCTRFCKPKNDARGHFVCDTSGLQVCRKNWYSLPNCTRFCAPSDSDIEGHYNCSDTGKQVCHSNWYNSGTNNCTHYCAPSDSDIEGHYDCSDTGVRLCHRHWYNRGAQSCSVYCKEETSWKLGFFNCTRNGSRVCYDNWHGANCTTYCKANDDDLKGHYNCTNDGTIICSKNYYGKLCTKYCLAQDNCDGHYLCNKTNGARVCLANWTGVYCNQSVLSTSYTPSEISMDFRVMSTMPTERSTNPLSVSSKSRSSRTLPSIGNFSSSQFAESSLSRRKSASTIIAVTRASRAFQSVTWTAADSHSVSASRSWKASNWGSLVSMSIVRSKGPPVVGSRKRTTLEWLVKSNEGKATLGGSAAALIIICLLIAAGVSYLKLDKSKERRVSISTYLKLKKHHGAEMPSQEEANLMYELSIEDGIDNNAVEESSVKVMKQDTLLECWNKTNYDVKNTSVSVCENPMADIDFGESDL